MVFSKIKFGAFYLLSCSRSGEWQLLVCVATPWSWAGRHFDGTPSLVRWHALYLSGLGTSQETSPTRQVDVSAKVLRHRTEGEWIRVHVQAWLERWIPRSLLALCYWNTPFEIRVCWHEQKRTLRYGINMFYQFFAILNKTIVYLLCPFLSRYT
jgi:hypothetical protein